MILEFFFFTFPKKRVGGAIGNEALNWDGQIVLLTFHVPTGISYFLSKRSGNVNALISTPLGSLEITNTETGRLDSSGIPF